MIEQLLDIIYVAVYALALVSVMLVMKYCRGDKRDK